MDKLGLCPRRLISQIREATWRARCNLLPTDAGWVTSVSIEMFSHGLGRMRSTLLKKDELPSNPTSLPHLTILFDSAIRRRNTLSQRSSVSEVAPRIKRSGLDRALSFILPRTSRPSVAKLKIAPSGAIVFTPVQSQESLRSPTLPGTITSQYNIRKLTSEHSGHGIDTFHYHKTSINASSRPSKWLRQEK